MSSQPKVSKNKRSRQHYNKPSNNKRNHTCRRPCDSCININININNSGTGTTGGTGGTDCFAVNDRCNEQLAACYEIAGNDRLGRFICNQAYNNCFSNAGCQQGGGGGGGDNEYTRCMDNCLMNVCEGTVPVCLVECERACDSPVFP